MKRLASETYKHVLPMVVVLALSVLAPLGVVACYLAAFFAAAHAGLWIRALLS